MIDTGKVVKSHGAHLNEHVTRRSIVDAAKQKKNRDASVFDRFKFNLGDVARS